MHRRRLLLLAASVGAMSLGSAVPSALGAPLAGVEGHAQAMARWLAGYRGVAEAPDTDEWRAYAEDEEARWRETTPRVCAMQGWASASMSQIIPHDRPVIYPFGGPDALHAIALFGDARHLTLIGLEPVLPAPEWGGEPPHGYFVELGAASADLHRLTFFRTRELHAGLGDVGVVPLLLSAIVHLGGQVAAMSFSSDARVRIDWTLGDSKPRRLEYVQADLSNGAFGRRGDLANELLAQGPFDTFLKAASYLLSEPRFSRIRSFLLENSIAVVEDDSGIPFHDFDARWGTRLFGHYVRPSSPFEDRLQLDLESAFSRAHPSPLPFGIGYHVRARDSNLTVAVRLSP